MRLNKFIAENTALSRRSADEAIKLGKITINGNLALLGCDVTNSDKVTLDGIEITPKQRKKIIVLLNKPIGYVCSKDGQGSPTVYDILSAKYKNLNIAGRLDKDSSGLVLLTNDGYLLQKLTHPSANKVKVYNIQLNKPLYYKDKMAIEEGLQLEDGQSKLQLTKIDETDQSWRVDMHEGRNRQIRRTFAAVGYTVTSLNRISIDRYSLSGISLGDYKIQAI